MSPHEDPTSHNLIPFENAVTWVPAFLVGGSPHGSAPNYGIEFQEATALTFALAPDYRETGRIAYRNVALIYFEQSF